LGIAGQATGVISPALSRTPQIRGRVIRLPPSSDGSGAESFQGMLSRILAGVIFVVAANMLYRNAGAYGLL
jgi:hypothetical protein